MNKTATAQQLKYLSREVENVFHCKISTATNCDQLSRDVQNRTSHAISSQTLRRFFGLVKTNTSASLFTLNALSQYCGHEDWSQFCLAKKNTGRASIATEPFTKWVLDFYKAPLPNLWPSPDYFEACKNIAQRIVMDKTLFESLPSQLAALPSGQILFFECFPYIDGLGNGYQKHLKVYLQHKAGDWQAKIFANCLLFLGSVLTKNDKQIEKYYSVVNSLNCPLPGQIHDIPTARYLGTQILYNHRIGNHAEVSRWLKTAMNEYAEYYKNKEMGFCNYFFMLTECLFLSGFYRECVELLKYMDDHKWRQYFNKFPLELGNYETARFMRAISTMKIGKHSVAKQILKSINTNSFFFTESKLYTLFYLSEQLNSCGSNAKKKKAKIFNQIDRLVADTGFVLFPLSSE